MKPNLVLRAHEEAERHPPGYQPPPCCLTGANIGTAPVCDGERVRDGAGVRTICQSGASVHGLAIL